MRTLLASFALAAAFGARAQTADVIWTADFEAGAASLTGNCLAGQNGWCNDQIIRPQQLQIVQDPVAQGHNAVRVEVKYGDVYGGYSWSRSLMTGPGSLWEDEGSERWYRWQVLWPSNWVGSYPKWDQLGTPDARSSGGSVIIWHHDNNGGVEAGSAPLYIGADDNYIWLCLVDQATSTCRERPNLAPLQRAHWHDFIVHAKWSSDKSIGFLEIWIDGVLVLPKHYAANKYPGMRNYLIAGIYRDGHIGDPNMLYPNGTHVYGTNGTPGVVYLDGFIAAKTQAAVLATGPFGPPPPPPPPPAADAGTPPSPPPPADDAGTPTPPADPPPTDPPPVEVSPPPADGGVPPKPTGLAALGYPGSGCSTGGASSAWLAAPLLVLLFLRRKRS